MLLRSGPGLDPLFSLSSVRYLSLSSVHRQNAAEPSTSTVTSSSDLPAAPLVPEAAVSTSSTTNEIVLDFLPEKPVPLPETSEILTQWVGDPPLEALGLASWWPSGRMQYLMEYMHVGFDMPWWGVIASTTLGLRFIVFPLVVQVQRNVANMNNHNPTMVALQAKISEARQRGDMYDVAKYGGQLQNFMKEHKIKPIASLVPILVQLPIFVSMFVGLRGMANLPLESMMHGGLFWFEDLTVADPFYALPLLTSATMFLQFKFAADGASFDTAGPIAKIFLRVLPFVLLPLTINFPAAVTFYWFSTNLISIVQAKIIRTSIIRQKLGIPAMVKRNKDNMPAGGGPKKGFRESIREMIDNAKVQADLTDRRRFDENAFRKAGTGRPKRTFKFDPTKPRV